MFLSELTIYADSARILLSPFATRWSFIGGGVGAVATRVGPAFFDGCAVALRCRRPPPPPLEPVVSITSPAYSADGAIGGGAACACAIDGSSSSFSATRLLLSFSGWPSGRRISPSSSSVSTAGPAFVAGFPPYGDTPLGGAIANRSSPASVSRWTVRTLHRSYLNDSADELPTPTSTPFQSSPLVLSTIAQPSIITLPLSPTTTR